MNMLFISSIVIPSKIEEYVFLYQFHCVILVTTTNYDVQLLVKAKNPFRNFMGVSVRGIDLKHFLQ